MSCKHGNYEGINGRDCDLCDAEDDIWKICAAKDVEIADLKAAYESLFKENAARRAAALASPATEPAVTEGASMREALGATPAPAVGANKRELVDLLTSAAWQLKQHAENYNHVSSQDLPGKLTAAASALAALGASVQPVQASLSDALLGAANYIDVLGGDSQKYRVVLASSTPTTPPGAATPKGCE